MEKKRKIKTLVTIFLIVALLGLTVVFANVTKLLQITGTAKTENTSFDVRFEDVTTETSNSTFESDPTVTNTSISYDVTLSGFQSSATVKFKIKNNNDFNVVLSSFDLKTPICEAVTLTGASSDFTNFCNQLSYTLKYKNDENEYLDVTNNMIILNGESKDMILTLSYNITDINNLPEDDVKISNLGVDMNFEQNS